MIGIPDRAVDFAIGQVQGRFVPSKEERAAAFELLVELLSRSTTQPLAGDLYSIRDTLTSMHEMFDVTRAVLRKQGPNAAKGTSGNVSLSIIALRVLNEELRPILNRWHGELLRHEARRPASKAISAGEWEREWSMAAMCRDALAGSRRRIVEYVDTLGQIAGAQSLAAAVISGPASRELGRQALPAPLDAAGGTPRLNMVRWLAPFDMVRTLAAKRPANADLADFAKVQGPDTVEATHRFDGVAGRDFWFDYIADTGDAFDGVAPVAWLAGRKRITIPPDIARGMPIPPPFLLRGELLVLGGDQVYPYASADRYRNQTELPFRMCFEASEAEQPALVAPEPVVLAIPGNHDWLGGIGHFEQVFTTRNPSGLFADHWRVVQDKRWWHVKLPRGWWLWGIDSGLDDRLPDGVAKYFAAAAAELQPGDRVILCTPVPLWQLRQRHQERHEKLRDTLVTPIRQRNATLALCLSGDSHYFAHFVRRRGYPEEHITAGGGGASLQPTHGIPQRIPVEKGEAEYVNTARWPPPADSRALAPGALPLRDWQTLVVVMIMAGLHVGFRGLTNVALGRLPWGSSGSGGRAAVLHNLSSPWSLLLALAVVGAGVVAVKANSREPGLLRAAQGDGAMLGAAVAVSLVGVGTLGRLTGTPSWLPPPAQWVGQTLLGGVLSTLLFFGVVNLINRRIRAADTLTYSRAHSTRYKHFLRFRIAANGDLTAFAIGIDPAGKDWFTALTKYAYVPPEDPNGHPRIHYVWGKTYPHPMRPLRVAVSISDPQGVEPSASTSVFVAVCTALIQAGHTLHYGGRPADGYTDLLARTEAVRYANSPVARAHLVNYVADYLWAGPPTATEDSDGIMRSVRVERPVRQPDATVDESPIEHVIRDLTAMRQRMQQDSDVRIIIGGDLTPGLVGTRLAPGVIEEAYLTVRAGKPLLVAGGFDGAAGLIADRLRGADNDNRIAKLNDHFAKPSDRADGFAEMVRVFRPDTPLNNKLSPSDNTQLLQERDPQAVATLILRSLDAIGQATGGP